MSLALLNDTGLATQKNPVVQTLTTRSTATFGGDVVTDKVISRTLNGSLTLEGNGTGAVNANDNLNPSIDATYDLGTGAFRWKKLNSQYLDLGPVPVTVVQGVSGVTPVTIPGNEGKFRIETFALSDATNAFHQFVVNHTAVTVNSVILVCIASSSNSQGTLQVTAEPVTLAGQFTVTIKNNSSTVVLNGTVTLSFVIF